MSRHHFRVNTYRHENGVIRKMEEEDRYTRITLRIPKDVHARLQQSADKTSKSMNAEIVARLDTSFTATETSSEILSLIATLQFELSQARYREQVQLLSLIHI